MTTLSVVERRIPRCVVSAINPQQREFLQEKLDYIEKQQPKFKLLVDKLLKVGGEMVVAPAKEADLQLLLSSGTEYHNPKKITNRDFRPNQCHINSLYMAMSDPKLQCITGYYLMPDGLWRQHSWVAKRGLRNVLETLNKGVAYFGAPLPDAVVKRRWAAEMDF